MRVETLTHVYTLYTGFETTGHAVWIMHVWLKVRDEERWVESLLDVSSSDPFKSSVKYDAWS